MVGSLPTVSLAVEINTNRKVKLTMLFLRFALLLIFTLGIFVCLISIRIRSKFFNTTGQAQPLFRGHTAEFEAFCKNPPTKIVSSLLQLQKKLSIALIIVIIAFLLIILTVAF
jgi:type IV secretory pathway VirB6-like protein